ncbi:MAG: iron-sulfur cluster assembly accessory protein [Alphaproteobacteria bacterium]|nr:iron-sulfur cluster assembly accessory protein [Alphaproteobacteria bacterium]
MSLNITITDTAAAQINKLLAVSPEGTQGLRLKIKTTGCSGNSYAMDYISPNDESIKDDDLLENAGAKLYIPKIYSWMLIGMTIDYTTDDLGNARFEFINPNETGRCGCGESFHIERKDN